LAAERTAQAVPTRLTRALPRGRVAEALLVGGLLLFAAVVHLLLARRVTAPWIFTDELLYSEVAKSVADKHHFLARGYPTDLVTLYPVLIAPAYLAKSISTAYGIAKGINVVLMTLAALPVYFWARRLVSFWLALLATGLTLLIPGALYSGTLMTENAFFPAFVLAAWLLAVTLERPTLLRQALLLGAVLLAGAMRVQGLVLGLVVPTAILFKVWLDIRADGASWRTGVRRLRPFAPTLGLLLLGAVLYALKNLVAGTSILSGLGGYAVTGRTHYSLTDSGRWILYHLGELFFSVGFLPAAAFIVMLGLACRSRNPANGAERAFLATTAASLLWIVPQVALFASRFSLRVEERNMFILSPLLLLALVVWLGRGMPRPYGLTIVALILPAALFATLPLESLFNISLLSDTLGFVPLYRLSQLASGGLNDVRIAVSGGFVAGIVLFALVPKRVGRFLVPAAVGFFLLLSSVSASNMIAGEARSLRAYAGTSPNWVDEAIGSDAEAAYLYAGDAASNPHLLWQTEFWNRSVDRVLPLGVTEPGSFANEPLTVDGSGRLSPATARYKGNPTYVVADPKVGVDGKIVATGGTGLALYRLNGPLRLASTTEGVTADGWSGPAATYTRYTSPGGRPGKLLVTVSRRSWSGTDVPGAVTITVGPLVKTAAGFALGKTTAQRNWVIHSGAERVFRLAAPAPPYRAEVHVNPTFSPSAFGSADTRQLGAQVRFQPAGR